jgi:MoxR-like ATPase
MSNSVLELTEKIKAASAWVAPLRSSIGQVIIGQQYLVDRLILGLISNGHVLLEGVPGLAKTLSVRTLACAINANFKRIQFIPDLLPADIIGTLIYNPKEHTFETKKGPVFANLVLADEINRAPAKVQSALLEAMQERQVTIGDETHLLPKPFLVLATENPIDQEGTYTLPEAQVDRFMLKLSVGYPSKVEEREILDRMATTSVMEDVKPVISLEDILNARKVVNEVYVDDKIKDYIVDIVFATRYPKDYKLESDSLIQFGGSPRATISLTLASKGWAFLQGRGYVTPQDVKTIAMDVLRHRVIVSYEAEAEGKTSEDIVQEILDTLPVP